MMYTARRLTRLRIVVGLAIVTLAAGCAPAGAQPAAGAPTSNLREGCVENYDPQVDYFPDKLTFDYAETLRISYEGSYKVVEYAHPRGEYEPATYVLVQCGTPAPELAGELAGATVIEVPVQRSVVTATPVLPFFDRFDVVDTISAVGFADAINTPSVRAGIEDGRIRSAGDSSGEPNLEVVLSVDPDVVIFPSAEPEAGDRLRQAGVPSLVTLDYTESTPLSRVEWTSKVVALLFNAERQADETFTATADEYQRVAALAAGVERRPQVAAFNPVSGGLRIWLGGNWQAQMVEDAGGDYLLDDSDAATAEVRDFEAVLDQAADADFILQNTGATWRTIDDMLAEDPRFDAFAAVREGNVINLWTSASEGADPAEDYWEAGVANPDQLLADLVAILHPELLPDHEPRFHFLLATE